MLFAKYGPAAVASFLLQVAAAKPSPEVIAIPNTVINGSTEAEFASSPGSNLDGHKLIPGPNATSYDWWYFDAVSSTTNESVTIVFFENGPEGFIQPGPAALWASVSGSFKNGSFFSYQVPAADKAVITQTSDTISGDWSGSGYSFDGRTRGNKSEYVVTINTPAVGVAGTLTLRSKAPPHYPCTLNKPGSSELIIPGVGWANVQPDAKATLSLQVGDAKLAFADGVGYHDKNWGVVPFVSVVQSWYWGHGRLGPYSVVWFDTLARDGNEYGSAYVAYDGKVIEAGCGTDTLSARPFGKNSTYPPTPAIGAPQFMALRFDLGDGKMLVANVTTEVVVAAAPIYDRMIGTIRGGIEGEGKTFEGRTLYEQFKFPL
ncbi:Hydroxyneurosporene dehydrogenase [Diplogelasinospora grovesii]|uniref:Hydroxyneurosporene dehydrogenase n=1 Tax=Diplogelasinospora grovesii TaxID=303347 RepID=A0AAN6N218_9PEZI|nr:Hydroxyneurosporene dehydrogenase [Diplogelasinospora grovesii]